VIGEVRPQGCETNTSFSASGEADRFHERKVSMSKATRKVAKAKMKWARDMRAREVVIAWLVKMGRLGKYDAPEKGQSHVEFAVRLQAILEPVRIERRFKGKKGAAQYVREGAKMVGGRDCLAPPKLPPLEVRIAMQRRAYEKRIEHRQRVVDAKRKATQQRIEAKIAKVDREVAERMEARRAESYARQRAFAIERTARSVVGRIMREETR
jgi:hypothetical protein